MCEWISKAVKQLPHGAFLIVDSNPMTIGWAQFGILWGKLCCTVYVRKSRYTHDLLEKSNNFVISVPNADTFSNELAICGTKSGRYVDKLALCNMRLNSDGGVAGCGIDIQCRVLYKSDLKRDEIKDGLALDRYYPDGDMHTEYIAEIIKVSEADRR